MHYNALVDGQDGAFGVVFPDLPGCTAMGDTIDEALDNAREALREWIEATSAMGLPVPPARSVTEMQKLQSVQEGIAEGALLARVLLLQDMGRTVKANITLDSGVLAAIDATAKRIGSNRSALIERMATERLPAYA